MGLILNSQQARRFWMKMRQMKAGNLEQRTKKASADRRLAALQEFPGRAMGKPHGSYVAGLVERKQTIVLCQSCNRKFDPRKSNYYQDTKYPRCMGNCDACKERDAQGFFYIHESLLTGPNGYPAMHGHSWVPR